MNICHILFIAIFQLETIQARCAGGVCEKFSCVSDVYVHRPLDNHLRSGSTFSSPCSCSNDWNAMFCNQTISSNLYPSPTVCICRKFSDNGAKCQQFITRCFPRRNNECSCCFNQPSEWCNQLKCKNREPDFSMANTTCVCHHNPSDYPYEICKNMYPIDSSYVGNRQAVLDRGREKTTYHDTEFVELLGRRISTSTITYIIVGLLVTVSLLTLIMLIAGGRKLRRRRSERQRQTRLARETLIMQRADDDRYLPSA